jgi:DNA-binding transcriptional MerR regulator
MAAPAYVPPQPSKTLYRIGEVSKLTNTKAFVLRYWETEFPTLQPVKSPSGHRLYRKEDIETVHEIKRLLYDKGFTIAGARRYLAEANGRAGATASADAGNVAADSRVARTETTPARPETSRGFVAPSKNEFEPMRKGQEGGPGLHSAHSTAARPAEPNTQRGAQPDAKVGNVPSGVAGVNVGGGAAAAPAKAPSAANQAVRAELTELRERLTAILTLLEGE